MRSVASARSNSSVGASQSDVAIFVVTTPDDKHITMLRNMLCSLFSSGDAANNQEISVLLHPGRGEYQISGSELQEALRSSGYARLNVIDSQEVLGGHPHWNSIKTSFPSNARVFGIRHALSQMEQGKRLLVIDEDVVCSPERLGLREDGIAFHSIPEKIAMHAPTGASVVCAHEVPGVDDVYNNGFCMYTASPTTDALLATVENRMVNLGFTGDQTPFNQIVNEGAALMAEDGSGAAKDVKSAPKSSDVVSTFGTGTVGYLRTWVADGFPMEHHKELSVVDSMKPENLVQWTGSQRGPMCLHYLPYSPQTHVWRKLKRQC